MSIPALGGFSKKSYNIESEKNKKNKKFGRIMAFLAPSFFIGQEIEI